MLTVALTTVDVFSLQILKDMGYEISPSGGISHGLRFQVVGHDDLSIPDALGAGIAKGKLLDDKGRPIQMALVNYQTAFLMRARSEVRPEEAVGLLAACHAYNMQGPVSGSPEPYVFVWRILIARATLEIDDAVRRFIDAMLQNQKGGSFIF